MMGSTLLVVIISLVGVFQIALRAVALKELRELDLLTKAPVESANFGASRGTVWQFVESVRVEPALVVRADLVAERLAEVDWETRGVALRVGMWARVALYFGAAASVVSVCKVLGRPLGVDVLAAFVPFSLGAAAASVGFWVGRWADTQATQRRWAWDRLSAAQLRPLLAEQISAPEPQQCSMRDEEKRSCPSGA
ncbi:MAG: hypothetical protein QM784_12300 [Polyangiaceae bacterium]